MHPRLAELSSYLATERAGVLLAVDAIAPDLRGVRPSEDGWSCAEVLEHLAMVERGVARVVARRAGRARDEGLRAEDQTGSVLGWLDGSAIRDDTVRRDAPEIVRPAAATTAAEALEALAASRASLFDSMRLADGLALGDVKHDHLALGEINLYQWLLFVGMHEGRHAAQLRRIAQSLSATRDTPRSDDSTETVSR
jgi:hypothetical protein